MDSGKLYRYYRPNGFGFRWLMYHFLLADVKLRHALNLGSNCGVVTFLTLVMASIVLFCTLASTKTIASNEEDFLTLQKEIEKKFPRKKSVTDIRPAYNCIRKHLQQTNVFQEKTKKMLCKELLEIDILNSKINCINKLLKPEAQSEWRQSRLPKVYYRPIISSTSK
ncbi:PREDICTED: uncharacterized protein LOC107191148 [Dufourea novaeangliae]|uniref:uncharacterized protein LOC107191148 n=1 Tax=Dufourea novaeangliae TaxID=178035 RepID=UPI000766F91F|nr:PREDICTED: uncharacterized protein LOC107191148 [Dufourea novaeangliae]